MLEKSERPWGTYEVLFEAHNHKVKTITVKPGKRLSLQRHKFRAEHWFIIAGTAKVTVGDSVTECSFGAKIDIEIGQLHRIENIVATDVTFIEVQTGTYFGEDDIERVEDDFGR